MQAVLLTGGLGTRLRPLTHTLPKLLVPVGLVPILQRVIDYLAGQSITQVIVTVAPDHKSAVEEVVSTSPIRTIVHTEPYPLGTAGAVKNVEHLLDQTFVVADGDVLTDMSLADLIGSHKKKKSLATIALVPFPDPTRFGTVVTDTDDRVSAFHEKTAVVGQETAWVNAGYYVWEKEVLSLIPPNKEWSVEKDVYPRLIAEGHPFFAVRPPFTYWRDVGVLSDYRQANWDILTGTSPFSLPVQKRSEGIYAGTVSISPHAVLRPPVALADGCRIAPRAMVGPYCLLGPFCRVEEGATVEVSILWERCTVATGATVRNCVLASRCTVRREATLHDCVSEGDRTLPCQ